MRYTRFLDAEGQPRFGIDAGDGHAELCSGANPLSPGEPTGQPAEIATRLAPIDPPNIYGIGLNYARHAVEMGIEPSEHPIMFMKPTTTVTHPGRPIQLPAIAHGPEVDFENELAVVIGQTARDVSEADALSYVLGYTVANDVSARHWQQNGGGGQWVRGKSFDTFCPLGPVLVTADEIGDPQDLELTTTLSGQPMQRSRTSDMIFTVAQIVSFLSRDTTLLPGTVILTGSPEGVGIGQDPPRYLRDGDEVTVSIERIGEMTNPVEDLAASA